MGRRFVLTEMEARMTDGIGELERLAEVQQQALEALAGAGDEQSLAAWRTAHLGRSSAVMQVFARLPQFDKALRPAMGQRANQVKLALEEAFTRRSQEVKSRELERSLTADKLDVTLPGRKPVPGRLHPTVQTLREIYRIWARWAFRCIGSGCGNGREQLRAAQHPALPPGAGYAGHFPYHHAGGTAAHAHIARADPGDDAARPGAHPGDPAGDVLPLRADQRPRRDPVPPGGRLAGRPAYHPGRPEGHAHRFRPAHVRQGCAHPLPPLLLPLHRTERRDGRGMLRLRRQGLRGVQILRLAGDPRLRDGPSQGRAAERRLRPGRVLRFRLRHGARAHHHAALPHR